MWTPACSPETRTQSLARLKTEVFDVLVLGGGINGAGVARDLALRARTASVPLQIALVEQRHFASGTSGRNSQLIHGGLRYLKQLEFRLVRQSLRERARLLALAPHLVQPLVFLMPIYGSWSEALYYRAGLRLYDLLAGRHNVGRHGRLPPDEVARLEPDLAVSGLSCALRFYDCRVHSARFVLANVFDAVRHGAAAANYVRACERSRENGLFRVELADTLTGERFEARARKLVDTTGPWQRGLRLVRGSHIVLPRLNRSGCALAHFDEAGRIVFVIPWGEANDLTLAGTTDVDHAGGPDCVRISRDEVEYLLSVVKRLYPSAAAPVAAFSSLRPLLRNESESPTAASREHRIWNSPEGVLHVAGGKYTAYRAMSEEAADLVAREIAPALARVHVTARTPLERDEPPADPRERIAYAIRHEMALTLADVMFVSTYWGYEGRDPDPCARECARLLGWDAARTEREIAAVREAAALPD